MNKSLALVLILVALSLSGPWAVATEQRHFSGSEMVKAGVSGDGITQLTLKVATGHVTILSSESESITYDVVVKEEPASWFGAALDDLVLDKKVVGQTLYLTIDEDDVSQAWTITVPKSLALSIQLGVGNIEASSLTQPFTADIGVGAVWLSLDPANYAEIKADVAVGEIQVKGLQVAQLKQQRYFISETLRYTGAGTHAVAINIGVGDVNISQRTGPESVASLTAAYSYF